MPRSVTCEVRHASGPWHEVGVEEAIKLGKTVSKRCVQCHGPVRVHKAADSGAAHVEHTRRHAGCPLGDCYDGNEVRPHPLAEPISN